MEFYDLEIGIIFIGKLFLLVLYKYFSIDKIF